MGKGRRRRGKEGRGMWGNEEGEGRVRSKMGLGEGMPSSDSGDGRGTEGTDDCLELVPRDSAAEVLVDVHDKILDLSLPVAEPVQIAEAGACVREMAAGPGWRTRIGIAGVHF